MFARTLRFIKYLHLRFIRLKGDPFTLAKGIGIGVFVGQTPTIPFQTVITLPLAMLFRAAKIPALLASMLTTPFTYYFASWKIGNWLTPWDLSWERIVAARKVVQSDADLTEIKVEFGKLAGNHYRHAVGRFCLGCALCDYQLLCFLSFFCGPYGTNA